MAQNDDPDSISDVTPQHRKLADAAAKIRQEHPWDAEEMGYMSKTLISASLPYTDPGDVAVWTRSNGSRTLFITPGYHNDGDSIINYGIPYGSIPRLILIWACTEVKIKKSPELELGKSLNAFLNQLGFTTGGAKAYESARKQIIRLFASSMAWEDEILSEGKNHKIRHTLPLMNKWSIWTNPVDQTMQWNSTITLSDDFFNEILQNFFPIDMRAIQALKNSPVALDLYMWLTKRMYSLGHTLTIPWPILYKQLGADMKEMRRFKRHIADRLTHVKVVYPGLNYEIDAKGLILKPSSPSVPLTRKI